MLYFEKLFKNFFQTGNKLSYELVGLVPGTTYSIDVRANTARDEDDAVPSATCTCTTSKNILNTVTESEFCHFFT